MEYLSGSLERDRIRRCSKQAMYHTQWEKVGRVTVINHADIHYRAPTQCWHGETAVLHFAITGMKGNLIEALGVKSINQEWKMVCRDSLNFNIWDHHVELPEGVNKTGASPRLKSTITLWKSVSPLQHQPPPRQCGVSHLICSTEHICPRLAFLILNRALGGTVNETGEMPSPNHTEKSTTPPGTEPFI